MELIFTLTSVMSLAFILLVLCRLCARSPLGPLSLPGVLLITTFGYFYLIPTVLYEREETTFFGWNLSSLELIHLAATLYVAGAAAALYSFPTVWRANPAIRKLHEPNMVSRNFWVLLSLAVLGVAVQVISGRLNLLYDIERVYFEDTSFAFLNLAFTLLITLTIVTLVRYDFNGRSILMLCAVFFVFLTVGLRFRMVILTFGAFSAFLLVRRRRIGWITVSLGIPVGLAVLNAIGLSRSYFSGLEISTLEGLSFVDLIVLFSGEAGPVFTLDQILNGHTTNFIFFDPWWIAITRLVPSFLWADKPYPEYLRIYASGYPDTRAEFAGISAPQHAEIFLQFGWPGLVVLSFVYFWIAGYTLRRLRRLGFEGRIAGYAVAPTFFGFYMVQRGYFSQLLVEYLFTFFPLFILYKIPRSKALQ